MMLRAFEFHLPLVGYGEDVEAAFSEAISGLLDNQEDAVRGDILYREMVDADYVEELVRAMEVTNMSTLVSGEA